MYAVFAFAFDFPAAAGCTFCRSQNLIVCEKVYELLQKIFLSAVCHALGVECC